MSERVPFEFRFPIRVPVSTKKPRAAANAIDCSIVVPVYNSQDCLEELARRVDQTFTELGCDYELILVDDGSGDGSWEVIKSLACEYPQISGISFRKNFGQDNALMAGLRQSRGQYVVIMDDDLQHDPGDIIPLRHAVESGFDAVYANYSRSKRQKFWKNAGSWFNDKIAGIVLKKPRDIYLSPFKILARPLVNEICKYAGAYPYVDGLIFRTTSHIGQIAVEHHRRFKGSSGYTFWKSVLVWSHLATNFSVFPLRIATCLGLFSAVMGFLLALYFIGMYFATQVKPEGWTSIFVSIQILGGIQLFTIGIAGEYIGKTFLTINRHPQYAIGETTPKIPKSEKHSGSH